MARSGRPVLAGRDEIDHLISRGGMGDGYEALDRQLQRRDAVTRFRGASGKGHG